MLSKTFKVLMKWIVTGKTYFEKLFVFDHGASMWFNLIYQVPFENFLFRPNTSLSTAVFSKFLTKVFFKFFFQKYQAFQKTWNSFTYKY